MTCLCIDVADLTAVETAIKAAGTIHLLVNNAGVSQLQPVLDTTPDAYDRYCDIDWLLYLCTFTLIEVAIIQSLCF